MTSGGSQVTTNVDLENEARLEVTFTCLCGCQVGSLDLGSHIGNVSSAQKGSQQNLTQKITVPGGFWHCLAVCKQLAPFPSREGPLLPAGARMPLSQAAELLMSAAPGPPLRCLWAGAPPAQLG